MGKSRFKSFLNVPEDEFQAMLCTPILCAGRVIGVINLRGVIVPIVDIRIKFGFANVTYDQFTVVIILNVAGRIVGMVVDGVSDVINLTSEQIRPAPEMGSGVNAKYIIGLGTIDARMLILVDIEKLMSSADMELMEQISH